MIAKEKMAWGFMLVVLAVSVASSLVGAQMDSGRPPVEVEDVVDGTAGNILGWDGSGVAKSLSRQMIIAVDEKTAGVNGGTFTQDIWQTRDLNTLRVNDGTLASLSSDQITLPAGTYECWISAPAFQVSQHMIRLRDITDDSTITTGGDTFSSSGAASTTSFIYHKFTLSVSSALEVQHICKVTRTANGFGAAGNFSVVETYTIAMFRKVD